MDYGALYVGDLNKDVTEVMLYQMFTSIGPIKSVHLNRNLETNESLGYAYINYENINDASQALETLNLKPINGRPMRVMWSQRNSPQRRTGKGYIIIKNLDESIDDGSLKDTFENFGTILSCKVSKDEEGRSKGFAVIQFREEEDARTVIEKVNGKLMRGKMVSVEKYFPGRENDENLTNRNQFLNLYVKSLDVSIDDDYLRRLFSQYGTITSAVVMKCENNRSKGFGFVCFSSHEEGVRALTEMNGRMVLGKRLYVSIAQRKEDRKQELVSQLIYNQSVANVFQQGAAYDMLTFSHPQGGFQTQYPSVQTPFSEETQTVNTAHAQAPMYSAIRYNRGQIASQSSPRIFSRPFVASGIRLPRPVLQPIPIGIPNPFIPANTRLFQPRSLGNISSPLPSTEVDTISQISGIPESTESHYFYTHQESTLQPSFTETTIRLQPTSNENITNEPTASQYSMNQDIESRLSDLQLATESQNLPTQATTSYPLEAITTTAQESLTKSDLANVSPEERRVMLYERLYPYVEKLYPNLASKITPKLFSFSTDFLLGLLKNPDLIKEHADDAKLILDAELEVQPDSFPEND